MVFIAAPRFTTQRKTTTFQCGSREGIFVGIGVVDTDGSWKKTCADNSEKHAETICWTTQEGGRRFVAMDLAGDKTSSGQCWSCRCAMLGAWTFAKQVEMGRPYCADVTIGQKAGLLEVRCGEDANGTKKQNATKTAPHVWPPKVCKRISLATPPCTLKELKFLT